MDVTIYRVHCAHYVTSLQDPRSTRYTICTPADFGAQINPICDRLSLATAAAAQDQMREIAIYQRPKIPIGIPPYVHTRMQKLVWIMDSQIIELRLFKKREFNKNA